MKEYLVSAIVSTYKSERFIRGMLEDLEAQTIADKLEIVIVDSNSPQNERAIVAEFQKKYDNIVYVRHHERESSHATWNRCIQVARGKYVTMACTDDRHRKDALARMVEVLEARPDIALVYANVYITRNENETFEKSTRTGAYRWLDFDPLKLLYCCFMGPQAMWRKNLHEKYGYMNGKLETAGDWEFWLRMSENETFLHLDEVLGLYLYSAASSEHRDPAVTIRENEEVKNLYIKRAPEYRAREARAKAAKIENLGATAEALKPPPSDPGSAIPALPEDLRHRRPIDFKYDELVLVLRGTETNEQIEACFTRLRQTTMLGINRRLRLVKAHPGVEEFRYNLEISPKTLDIQTALYQAFNWECEYVILVTPDVILTDNWLERMLEVAKADPLIAAAGPMTNEIVGAQKLEIKSPDSDNDIQKISGDQYTRHGKNWEPVDFLGNFCLLLKTDAVRKVGGLMENYPTSANLKDLYQRLQKNNFKLALAKGVYVHRKMIHPPEEQPEISVEDLLESLLKPGQDALERDDFSKAHDEFLKITQQYPDLAAGHAALGTTLLLMERPEEAVGQFKTAIDLAPQVLDLHNQLGIALFKTRKLGEAESAFLEAYKRDPKDIQTILNLIELYRERDMYDEATAYLKQAVKIAPRNPEVLTIFGELSHLVGDDDATHYALKRMEVSHRDHPGYRRLKQLYRSDK